MHWCRRIVRIAAECAVLLCIVKLNNIRGGVTEKSAVTTSTGAAITGKTTLLDVLAGRKPSNLVATGEVLINGHATKLSYGTVSYVPQSDLLTGTLTVHETLTFTAALRFASPITSTPRVLTLWRTSY